ncbi:MAG TPA: hypothetical protein VF998_00255 [Candidatus Limnocylindria bacterium]
MAGALRPVVVLMTLATALFVADALLDGVYPGGPAWLNQAYHGLGWIAYAFAVVNLGITVAVARGSERTLVARIALSAFFLAERPLTAFVLGPKPMSSIVVHFGTAVVELVILISALQLWQLGRSLATDDVDAALAIDAPVAGAERLHASDASSAGPTVRMGTAWLIGLLTLVLAAGFVADGLRAGFSPGGRDWGLSGDAAGWVVYLFAVVILTLAARAVHGGLALRLLVVLALIFFIERAFSAFAMQLRDPVALALHGVAAFVALALALAAASAIRAGAEAPIAPEEE